VKIRPHLYGDVWSFFRWNPLYNSSGRRSKKEVKGKVFPLQAQQVGRGIALHFHDRGTIWGEWSAARPGRTLPPRKTRHPLYTRLGGPQGWSGRADNVVPTGIRSRTVQPVVSRYTDWVTRPTGEGVEFVDNRDDMGIIYASAMNTINFRYSKTASVCELGA